MSASMGEMAVCKPCREAIERGEMPAPPTYIAMIKPNACYPCHKCGERCYDPVAKGRCLP